MSAAEGVPVPVPVPMEGTLDLHTFRPQEAVAVVEAFVEESYKRKWREIRIVHGKGTGALREKVHAYLRTSRWVESFRLGNETSGGWGATVVVLRKKQNNGRVCDEKMTRVQN